jgi:hypothetical protein
MLIIAAALLAVVLVPPLGGKLRGLADLRLTSGWLIALALGVQVLCISVFPTWPRLLLASAHGATYLLAALFVWRNRRLPGLPLLALGGALNAVTIGLNGGTLPASASALRRAGLPVTEDQFINSGVLAHPKLAFLGDVFASPSWLPLRNVYSVGDLLILAGAIWAVHRSCRSLLARDPRGWLGQRSTGDSELRARCAELEREHAALLAAVREVGHRNDELRRELVRLRQQRVHVVQQRQPGGAVRQTVSG